MNTAPKLRDIIKEMRETTSHRDRSALEEMIWNWANQLAALAPPSGEGVAIYQCMCTDDDTLRNGSKDVWMDVDAQSYGYLRKRDDVRSRIVYTTPQSAPEE